MDTDLAYRVHIELYKLKNYAKSIYHGFWEDALDKSFFHIMEHFNEDCGDLEHYTIKVVSTIYLGRYKHEMAHDTSVTLETEKFSAETDACNPLSILTEREELDNLNNYKSCIEYLIPNFIQDSIFFMSNNPDDRKCKYDGLFSKFSVKAISIGKKYLVDTYGSDMQKLNELKKSCRYRNFNKDRYKSSMDTTIEYLGTFRGVLMYRSTIKKTLRCFYSIRIDKIVSEIIYYFYNKKSKGRVKIEDKYVYCTLSGQFVIGVENLKDCLESEIVGTILARMSAMKVVYYEQGKEIVFSSSREIFNTLPIEFDEKVYHLGFSKIKSKRVKEFNKGRR